MMQFICVIIGFLAAFSTSKENDAGYNIAMAIICIGCLGLATVIEVVPHG